MRPKTVSPYTDVLLWARIWSPEIAGEIQNFTRTYENQIWKSAEKFANFLEKFRKIFVALKKVLAWNWPKIPPNNLKAPVAGRKITFCNYAHWLAAHIFVIANGIISHCCPVSLICNKSFISPAQPGSRKVQNNKHATDLFWPFLGQWSWHVGSIQSFLISFFSPTWFKIIEQVVVSEINHVSTFDPTSDRELLGLRNVFWSKVQSQQQKGKNDRRDSGGTLRQ